MVKKTMENPRFIAVFDSGAGGLTVLAEMIRIFPGGLYHYFADTAYAPYGQKPRQMILERSLRIAESLLARGAMALVVACNTATSIAINEMRRRFSFPVVGMEPALKPAMEARLNGDILVMGTSWTIREQKYQRLRERFPEAPIRSLPCPGLVELVERGQIRGSAMKRRLEKILEDIDQEHLAAVVLGCTHYVYLKPVLKQILGEDVRFFDGNAGTARRLLSLVKEDWERRAAKDSDRIPAGIRLESSGRDSQTLKLYRRLLEQRLPENYVGTITEVSSVL